MECNVTCECTTYWVVRLIALMMETARTSETLVNFYQTTRRYNPEDSHLRTYRRENLKSYMLGSALKFDERNFKLHLEIAYPSSSSHHDWEVFLSVQMDIIFSSI
jgi:hypothetical protein